MCPAVALDRPIAKEDRPRDRLCCASAAGGERVVLPVAFNSLRHGMIPAAVSRLPPP